MIYEEKCLLCYTLLIYQSLLFPLLLEILNNMSIAVVSFLSCDVITFEINFSNQAVFSHGQKVKTKIKIS